MRTRDLSCRSKKWAVQESTPVSLTSSNMLLYKFVVGICKTYSGTAICAYGSNLSSSWILFSSIQTRSSSSLVHAVFIYIINILARIVNRIDISTHYPGWIADTMHDQTCRHNLVAFLQQCPWNGRDVTWKHACSTPKAHSLSFPAPFCHAVKEF